MIALHLKEHAQNLDKEGVASGMRSYLMAYS